MPNRQQAEMGRHMILGIGIDLVEVADLERRLERSSFNRVFTEAEWAYADSQPKRRVEILAARWAAKEAFLKAIGTGIRTEWPLTEIEVIHDADGRPSLRFGPVIAAHVEPDARILLSLSHTPASAIAMVIIERPDRAD